MKYENPEVWQANTMDISKVTTIGAHFVKIIDIAFESKEREVI